ncbi:hypothetical protein Tco_1458681 [Tanacetum coccineum]
MFNEGVDMLSLYIICSTEESMCYRCILDVQRKSRIGNKGSVSISEKRVRLLVGSSGASTTPIYSPGSSSTPIYSPGASTPQSYSPGSSRNAECSNCKHLLDKITVLEVKVKMYLKPEQHTVNSAALLHEVYNDMGKLDLE